MNVAGKCVGAKSGCRLSTVIAIIAAEVPITAASDFNCFTVSRGGLVVAHPDPSLYPDICVIGQPLVGTARATPDGETAELGQAAMHLGFVLSPCIEMASEPAAAAAPESQRGTFAFLSPPIAALSPGGLTWGPRHPDPYRDPADPNSIPRGPGPDAGQDLSEEDVSRLGLSPCGTGVCGATGSLAIPLIAIALLARRCRRCLFGK